MKEILLRLTKKQKIILGIILAIILIIIMILAYKYFYVDSEQTSQTEVIENNTNNIENDNDIEDSDDYGNEGIINNKKKKATIIVHVIGEVNKPGVVRLNEGQRIIDAIEASGGQTENADLSKVNLAYIVEDGTQIYIPKYNENTENKELIREDAGEEVVKDGITNNNTNETNSKVNINTATKEKLVTLPGIGDSMAEKIINYRTQNGKFNKIEDIKKVNGIGDSKYNNIKDRIIVK